MTFGKRRQLLAYTNVNFSPPVAVSTVTRRNLTAAQAFRRDECIERIQVEIRSVNYAGIIYSWYVQ